MSVTKITDHQAEAFNRLIEQYDKEIISGLNPMERNPTGAFATRRLTGIKSAFVLKLHRNSDDVLIDVYDFKQNDTKYKATAGGPWIEMIGDTYFIDTWYNQNVVGNDISQSTKAKKPTVIPNQRNGWPALGFDSVDDEMATAIAMNNFIIPSVGVMMAGYKPKGVPPTTGVATPSLLQPIITDSDAFTPMTRGISTPIGPNDSIFANIFFTSETWVAMEVLAGNWYDATWKLLSSVLYGFRNGLLVNSTAAGPAGSSLDTVLKLGHHPFTGVWLEGDLDQIYTFNKDVIEQDIFDISEFMRLE